VATTSACQYVVTVLAFMLSIILHHRGCIYIAMYIFCTIRSFQPHRSCNPECQCHYLAKYHYYSFRFIPAALLRFFMRHRLDFTMRRAEVAASRKRRHLMFSRSIAFFSAILLEPVPDNWLAPHYCGSRAVAGCIIVLSQSEAPYPVEWLPARNNICGLWRDSRLHTTCCV
jgi:hypothetical protein